jgi:hypothetical protein
MQVASVTARILLHSHHVGFGMLTDADCGTAAAPLRSRVLTVCRQGGRLSSERVGYFIIGIEIHPFGDHHVVQHAPPKQVVRAIRTARTAEFLLRSPARSHPGNAPRELYMWIERVVCDEVSLFHRLGQPRVHARHIWARTLLACMWTFHEHYNYNIGTNTWAL